MLLHVIVRVRVRVLVCVCVCVDICGNSLIKTDESDVLMFAEPIIAI